MYRIIIIYVLSLIVKFGNGTYERIEYEKTAPMREDFTLLAMEDYNSVFFSNFPINHFSEEDYESYYGFNLLKTSYCIPDIETLNEYFIRMSESQNNVTTVYLGIRPDYITAEELLNLVDTWEDIQFEVIMAYPSLEYWYALDDEKYSVKLSDYMNFVTTLMPCYETNSQLQDNLSLYFYNSSEWLVGNRANYDYYDYYNNDNNYNYYSNNDNHDDFNTIYNILIHYNNYFSVNEGIAGLLSMYSNPEYKYQLTLENYNEILEDFELLVNNCRSGRESVYPDLSDWDVIFFGDSVIAFSTTSSIPDAFSGLTGAHTYNCGRGGSSASMLQSAFPGIPSVIDSFLSEDLTPFVNNFQIYTGMSDYFENSDENRQKCFIINLGLNDYFYGFPVKSDDPYDPNTYTGALRMAIEKLQDAYPNAVIVLMTPNFTSLFNNGLQPLSDAGDILPDYVAAVISICHEKNLPFYDSYNLLGINSSNYTEYLMDDCHPNEATRYAMARGLAQLMTAVVAEQR